jgi:hypothetical protein
MTNQTPETPQPQVQDWHRAAAEGIVAHPELRGLLEGNNFFGYSSAVIAEIIARHAPPPDTVNADLEAALRDVHRLTGKVDRGEHGPKEVIPEIRNITAAALTAAALTAAEKSRDESEGRKGVRDETI